jgi:hypothetical protein
MQFLDWVFEQLWTFWTNGLWCVNINCLFVLLLGFLYIYFSICYGRNIWIGTDCCSVRVMHFVVGVTFGCSIVYVLCLYGCTFGYGDSQIHGTVTWKPNFITTVCWWTNLTGVRCTYTTFWGLIASVCVCVCVCVCVPCWSPKRWGTDQGTSIFILAVNVWSSLC